ncbi:hypothetical protein RHSIM_Rhsim08G0108200 [Rhododendron simsii]|uniref:AB hydrolase-1 domain-containing protein n=1 Tax=Rhododendron simsii TaxID=118357 RepID=A0A834GLN8_RHOSS|nr:hypothetical protein RHSIM_Rhsim08G0108200 [Rhododendron simsii]
MPCRSESERHFVLVHGACHGAWCWYRVGTLLKSAGHRVTALDMAGSGVHPKQLSEIRSMADYYQPLMEFMESVPADERVVLVGHSAGGISISVAMERFPEKVSLAVFVTAFMHGPTLTLPTVMAKCFEGMESWMDCRNGFDKGLDKLPTSLHFGPKYLESMMYEQSPPEDLSLATVLMRPYPIFHDYEEMAKDTALTEKNHGSVRRVYIVIEEDSGLKECFQRWMIENNPPDEVKVISCADHMVMFSKPVELSSCLQALAED